MFFAVVSRSWIVVGPILTVRLSPAVRNTPFGIPLLGVMDLVLPQATGPLIAAFKTAAKSSEPLEISHEIQPSCESYLFRQAPASEQAVLEIRSLPKT